MGVVRFGQQHLTIDAVPDGHIIILEAELTRMRQNADAYSVLKSKIPLNVSEDQLTQILEKGSRYDSEAQRATDALKKAQEFETQLGNFKDIPQGFSKEKWNKYVKAEQDAIRQGKISDLTKKVYEKVAKETGIKREVDQRFIPADQLNSFDPDDPEAFDKWYKILDAADTEQLKFVQTMGGALPSSVQPPKQGGPTPVGGQLPSPTDTVGAAGAKLQHF